VPILLSADNDFASDNFWCRKPTITSHTLVSCEVRGESDYAAQGRIVETPIPQLRLDATTQDGSLRDDVEASTKWKPLTRNIPKHSQNTHKQAKCEEARLTHFILSYAHFYDKCSFLFRGTPMSTRTFTYLITHATRILQRRPTTAWKWFFFLILPYWTAKRLDAASDVGGEMWLFWHSFISGQEQKYTPESGVYFCWLGIWIRLQDVRASRDARQKV